MANLNSTTPLFPPPPNPKLPPILGEARSHSHLLVAYLKVSQTALDRAARAADCPDVKHLVERAQFNLDAAHDLVQTDMRWAG